MAPAEEGPEGTGRVGEIRPTAAAAVQEKAGPRHRPAIRHARPRGDGHELGEHRGFIARHLRCDLLDRAFRRALREGGAPIRAASEGEAALR